MVAMQRVMRRVIGIEMPAMVMRARITPVPDAARVIRGRRRYKASATLVMPMTIPVVGRLMHESELLRCGGGRRRGKGQPRNRGD
jgi:hypothetical protein